MAMQRARRSAAPRGGRCAAPSRARLGRGSSPLAPLLAQATSSPADELRLSLESPAVNCMQLLLNARPPHRVLAGWRREVRAEAVRKSRDAQARPPAALAAVASRPRCKALR
mmetsp:Transcript_100370/g.323959  ORF Transcript_100370/g.323959 Transcript_100370/m.323959 type:complete len:112 (+) Transcript_100370:2098-2433(+)